MVSMDFSSIGACQRFSLNPNLNYRAFILHPFTFILHPSDAQVLH